MNYSCSFFIIEIYNESHQMRIFHFTQFFDSVFNGRNYRHYFFQLLRHNKTPIEYISIYFRFSFFSLLSPFSHAIHSSITGGPLGLFIIFPEPIFGPPFTASNCDIKRRTICWTPNTNRIHVQRWSKCTVLSAFCSLKDSRIVEGNYQHHSYFIRFNCYWPLTRLCNNCLCFFFMSWLGKRFGRDD